MENRKYEFTGRTKQLNDEKGTVVCKIRAARDFGEVKTGEEGGWIEKESNLSHEGGAWVRGAACVYGDARVEGDAQVSGNAHIGSEAHVTGHARVCGNAQVYGRAYICNKTSVLGDACVSGNTHIAGRACVYGKTNLYGDAHVGGNAEVYGNACAYGNAEIYGDAHVAGRASVHGDTCIDGNAEVMHSRDYLTVAPIGSRGGPTTFFRNAEGGIYVKCGCFSGSIEEFLQKVEKTHKNNRHAAAYRLAAELAQIQILWKIPKRMEEPGHMEEGLRRAVNENFDSSMYRLDLQCQPQEKEDGNGKDNG